MAYVPRQDEEDEETGFGPSAVSATAAAPAVGSSTTFNPSAPSRFTNFSSYFSANNAGAMGDKLVGDLDSKASGAQTDATKAKDNVVSQAQSSTIAAPTAGQKAPAPPQQSATRPPVYGVPSYGSIKQGLRAGPDGSGTAYAQGQAARAYTGPTGETVYSTFDPLMQAGAKAQKNINTAQDAAGVQAIQGGTGFDATLTSAGAGGRKSELKGKYAKLYDAMEGDRKAAWEAANKAAADSGAALGEWKTAADAWNAYDTAVGAQKGVDEQMQDSRAKSRAQPGKEAAQRSKTHTGAADTTHTISDEIYALQHGLTLEEWIRAGKPNLQHATPMDIERMKKGGG